MLFVYANSIISWLHQYLMRSFKYLKRCLLRTSPKLLESGLVALQIFTELQFGWLSEVNAAPVFFCEPLWIQLSKADVSDSIWTSRATCTMSGSIRQNGDSCSNCRNCCFSMLHRWCSHLSVSCWFSKSCFCITYSLKSYHWNTPVKKANNQTFGDGF